MREIVVPNTWRDRLEALAGNRRETWVIACVVAAAVLGALLLWNRRAPTTIAPPSTYASPPAPAYATSGATAPEVTPSPGATPQAVGLMYVHVAGAVRRPGLYELPSGARVADAIRAARGPRAGADIDALNLAELVTDGQKIYVARRGESPPPGSSSGYATGAAPLSGSTPTGVISLNSADQAALETIPGIGPVTASAILDYRSQIGSFSSIDQLLEVSGIGPATLEAIRPYITL